MSLRSDAKALGWLQSAITTTNVLSMRRSLMLRTLYFSLSSVVLCNFSVLCMYSKFRHHPHPPGYLCVKCCFFHGPHWWASPWRKIVYSINQSITQSLTQSVYLMRRGLKLLLRKNTNKTELNGEPYTSIFLFTFGLVITDLTFWPQNLISSFPKCTKIANLVKFPQVYYKISCAQTFKTHASSS